MPDFQPAGPECVADVAPNTLEYQFLMLWYGESRNFLNRSISSWVGEWQTFLKLRALICSVERPETSSLGSISPKNQ